MRVPIFRIWINLVDFGWWIHGSTCIYIGQIIHPGLEFFFKKSSVEMSTRPIFTEQDISEMRAKGQLLPATFLMRADDGRVVNMVLKPGSRITKPENPRITDDVRVALITLADLTEYHRIGADVTPSKLSDLIDSGAAFACAHEARLRELIVPRVAQLEAWLASSDRKLFGAPVAKPSAYTDAHWAREQLDWDRLRNERVKQAQACTAVLRRF